LRGQHRHHRAETNHQTAVMYKEAYK
jgi:hypothetical protein